MARRANAVVESAEVTEHPEEIIDDLETKIAGFRDVPGAKVVVMKYDDNGLRCALDGDSEYAVDAFSPRIVARDYGGGKYFAQVMVNGQYQRGGSGTFNIDRSIRPAPRTVPPPQHQQSYAWAQQVPTQPTLGGLAAPAPDPMMALVQTLIAEVRALKQEPRPSPTQADGPSWRDIIEVVRAQQPSAQVGMGLKEIVTLLPELMKMAGPKSSVAELMEATKLVRMFNREPAVAEEPEGSGLPLEKMLDVFLQISRQQPPSAPAQAVPAAPPPALPAAPAAPAAAPMPATAGTPMPPWVSPLAEQLAARFASGPGLTTGQLVNELLSNIEADEVAKLIEGFGDGELSYLLMSANPALQPSLPRLLMLEGALREAVTDDGAEEETGDVAPPIPFTQGAPEPTPVPPPATPAPEPVKPSEPKPPTRRKGEKS